MVALSGVDSRWTRARDGEGLSIGASICVRALRESRWICAGGSRINSAGRRCVCEAKRFRFSDITIHARAIALQNWPIRFGSPCYWRIQIRLPIVRMTLRNFPAWRVLRGLATCQRNMSELFESKPRWPGAPKICLAANLPAFATRKEMKTFQDAHCGSALKQWECDACGCFHYDAKPHAPAGGSSGNERRAANCPERAEVLAELKRSRERIAI